MLSIIGYYIDPYVKSNTIPAKRFIFAMVWAILSIPISILEVIPERQRRKIRVPWPADFVLAIGWWAVFGLIVKGIPCGGFFSVAASGDVFCRNWKIVQWFSLLGGVAWLVTGLFGIQFVQARRRGGRGGGRMY